MGISRRERDACEQEKKEGSSLILTGEATLGKDRKSDFRHQWEFSRREKDASEQQRKERSPLVLSGEATLGEYIELLSI